MVLSFSTEKWTASIEGGKPFPALEGQLRELEQSFTIGEEKAYAISRDASRKLGDTWEAGPAAFHPAVFGEFVRAFQAEQVEGKVTVEFKEQKVFEGAPCALLKLTFDIKGQSKEKGTLTFKGEGKVLRSLREKIDMAWEHKGVIRVSEAEGDGSAMSLEGPITVSGLVEAKRP